MCCRSHMKRRKKNVVEQQLNVNLRTHWQCDCSAVFTTSDLPPSICECWRFGFSRAFSYDKHKINFEMTQLLDCSVPISKSKVFSPIGRKNWSFNIPFCVCSHEMHESNSIANDRPLEVVRSHQKIMIDYGWTWLMLFWKAHKQKLFWFQHFSRKQTKLCELSLARPKSPRAIHSAHHQVSHRWCNRSYCEKRKDLG